MARDGHLMARAEHHEGELHGLHGQKSPSFLRYRCIILTNATHRPLSIKITLYTPTT
ncbi:predicted protein [Botrytis cinerea T4]|uniref:Uncharacterized protein n=1 Tax=Botryotinia fuckeliana (strain T4) TaxID=999810 RepID=G2YSL8_BOTF4|nr:predicted protein [Botrytis cinerea T4]